jgi:hypothetical protein
VGQTLARLELQVVVASLVAGFNWTPGQCLQDEVRNQQQQKQQQEQQQHSLGQDKNMRVQAGGDGGLDVCAQEGIATAETEAAAGGGASEAAVAALKACAVSHITLQPKGGSLC